MTFHKNINSKTVTNISSPTKLTLDQLPEELLIKTAQSLDYSEIRKLRHTCEFFNNHIELKNLQNQKYFSQIELAMTEWQTFFVYRGVLFYCGFNPGYEIKHNEEQDFSQKVSRFTPINNASFQKAGGVKAVYPSNRNTFVLCYDGTLFAIGSNLWGQLGVGDTNFRGVFCEIDSGIIKRAGGVQHIYNDAGGSYTFILCQDGQTLLGAGKNSDGQLGFGDKQNKNSFHEIQNDAFSQNGGIQQIFCSYKYVLILMKNGKLFASGDNEYGQIGVELAQSYSTFIEVNNDNFQKSGGIQDVVIEGCFHNTRIICKDGSLFVCGQNKFGQLGLGHENDQTTFVKVNEENFKNSGGVKSVSTSSIHMMILCNNGDLFVSGSNYNCQLGLENLEKYDKQNTFAPINDNRFKQTGGIQQVFLSSDHSFIICKNNTFFSCGNNRFDFDHSLDRLTESFTPINVYRKQLQQSGGIRKVYVNKNNMFILCNNGELFSYGRDKYGSLDHLVADKPFTRCLDFKKLEDQFKSEFSSTLQPMMTISRKT